MSEVVLRFTVPGEPCSKSRPQWSSKTKTMYTPAATRAREEVIHAIAVSNRKTDVDPMALFAVSADFYLWSNHVRDLDNMVKLVLDGLKGVVWADDVQVSRLAATKGRADLEHNARTEVIVEQLPGQVPWVFGRCKICQRQFRLYPSHPHRDCCSRRCWGITQRKDPVTLKCDWCGKGFQVRESEAKAGRRFCSNSCRYLGYTPAHEGWKRHV